MAGTLGDLMFKPPALPPIHIAADSLRREVNSDGEPPMALRDYTRQAWHIVEPASAFVSGWHIDALCEHLEAVLAGSIRNLLVNMPPRHMKSLTVSVMFCTWAWIFAPHLRWLYSSYAQKLSTRDSVKCRRIIESGWYRNRWGTKFRLAGDQNEKTRFENDRSGYRIATSVTGSATGEGGDVVLSDDPHNVKEAHSKARLEAVIDWWDQVMSTRLNDPKTGSKIIVMQRVHEKDLSQHVLDNGDYEHLMLPTEYEPARSKVTSIGWKDPRTEEGELLWPERFGTAEVKAAKLTLGSYGFAGQHEQRPAPAGGGIFKRDWFEIVDALPAEGLIAGCRAWDCAATEEDGDYTVGTKILRYASGIYIVVNVVRGQWSAGVVDSTIKQTALADGPTIRIREEQEPGSSGKSVVVARTTLLAGFDYRGIPASGDKVTRAKPFAIQCEAKNVKLLKGEWNQEWLDEISLFPYAGHDDQADSASGAFNELALPTFEWGPVDV